MKIKNLKFFLSASILVCFTSIFLLSCVGCGGVKNGGNTLNEISSTNIIVENSENKTLPKDSKTDLQNKETTQQQKQPITIDNNGIDAKTNTLSRIPKVIFSNGNTLKMKEINPYESLEYPTNWVSKDGWEISYNLSNLSGKMKDQILNKIHLNSKAFITKERNLTLIQELPRIISNGEIIAVSFNQSFYSNEEDILGTRGITKIIDNDGDLINQIDDPSHGFNKMELSPDGEFLMQKYGSNYGEDGGGQTDTGFKFYRLKSGNKVYEIDMKRDRYIRGYGFYKEHHDFFIYRSTPEFWQWIQIEIETGKIINKKWRRNLYSIEDFDKESANINWGKAMSDYAYMTTNKIKLGL